MEATALCIRLLDGSLVSPLMTVLLLLVAQVDSSSSQTAAFPRVDPNRQQLFQYEPIVFSCEGLQGLTGWRVMKKSRGVVKACSPNWLTSTGPCKIKNAIPAVDSGEYWCEMGRKRSHSVNITVTDGPVILDSPVLPVMDGDAVTLRCRNRTISSNPTAEFFKDGRFMERSSTGEMTLHSVSTSDEGLYKCSISGVGGSPESRLTVRAHEEEPPPSSHHAPQLSVLLYIGLSVLALLLLVVFWRFRKHQSVIRGATTSSSFQPSSSPREVSGQARIAVPLEATYAVVTRPREITGY
ncbi:low affinity immunoglobulin gamma Fc region receptor II-a-like isoform X2 [Chelmon rostratus]|uniref:low affinity immunoglobulin gamma Fc region receptor II-a-like isoform X2 n=1 Tax=Chelmon rostratus TaxID=109905 RepID=UPI001BE56709|nr:low affinity immunoglobulin gamma Fc region receptor II-a-like isoform X2 [Chelmon rostratus]